MTVPHERIVARARTRTRLPVGSAVPSMPTTRPPSRSTRSARTLVSRRAPCDRALGTYDTSMLRRAPVGHP